ncbi:MAG: META domain-containing protein [Saonia sp.]
MKKLSFLICAFLLSVSCSENEDANLKNVNLQVDAMKFETLTGVWNLESLVTENTLVPPSPVTVDFSLDDGSEVVYALNGISSCNQYGGELVALTENSISFKQLYSTDMLCSEELNTFESQYFNVLFDTEKYSIEDGKLKLQSGNTILTFYRE